MEKTGTYLLYRGARDFAASLVYMSFVANNRTESSNTNASVESAGSNASEAQVAKPAEKIQVFVFHSTNRCYSCVLLGQLTKKTVEQKFPDELKSGKIEFKEINVDLPQNKEVVAKFKAVGSSLFINPIIDGQDNIEADVQVWRLVSNEQGFISYLSEKIKGFLDGEAKT